MRAAWLMMIVGGSVGLVIVEPGMTARASAQASSSVEAPAVRGEQEVAQKRMQKPVQKPMRLDDDRMGLRPVTETSVRGNSLQQNSVDAKVALRVKDSTLAYIVRRLARQAGLRLAYDSDNPVFDTRMSLEVRDVPVLEAFAQALHGTGLVARVAADGRTVLIGAEGVSGKLPPQSQHQNVAIVGAVRDSATGKVLSGVLVTVQGTKRSVLTNGQGVYTLASVPAGSQTLSFKLIGYRTLLQTVTVISDKQPIVVNVSLAAVATALSEVVTTVTGAQRRLEVPGDIVRIDAAKIMERAPVQSMTDLIEAAQVPGVVVTRGGGDPGAPSRIRIRGLRSMTSSNDPVVIVDGNWIDASVGTPSGFDDIDPATIETVEIVRGPSASTLYGADAANGVIVITTKRGRAGPTRWNTSYQRSWEQTYGTIPLAYAGVGHDMSGQQRWCPIADILKNSCVQDSVVIYDPNVSLLKAEGMGATHRWIASVDGGTSSAAWSLTGTATNTIGVRQMRSIDRIRYRLLDVPVESKFQRPTSEVNRTLTTALTFNPMPSVTLGLTVTGSQNDLPNNVMSADYTIFRSNRDPNAKQYSLDTMRFWGGASFDNLIAKTEAFTRRSSLLLGGRLDWRAPSGWLVSANAGINRVALQNNSFSRRIVCRGEMCADSLGSRMQSQQSGANLTGRFNISKRITLGALSRFLDLHPSFGGDYRKTDNENIQVSVDSLPVGERSIAVGGRATVSSASTANAVAGYYANLQIGLFQRLYFDLGGRQDLGSALKKLVNGAMLPKLGGSYVISDEPFWPQHFPVRTLRLRSGFGYSVIQPTIEDIRGQYMGGYTYIDGQWVSIAALRQLGNVALKPERVMEFELGFDADLFGDRVNIKVNYAQSENVNATVLRTLPPSLSAGSASQRKENIGRVRNRSVEMESGFTVVDSRAVRLTFSHALTLQDNIVTKLGNKVTPFSYTAVGQIRQGYPIAGVWVNQLLGWRDANQDGLLAPDEVVFGDSMVYAGGSQPQYTAGYGVTVTLFGRLTFDTRVSSRSHYVVSYTQDNRYGQEDATAPLTVQAGEVVASINQRRPISDWRWNSASVTWFLPQRTVRALKLRDLSVSVKASDLGVWTNYAGRDPGVNSAILISENLRDNGNTTPKPRKFVFDFRLGL